MSDTVLIALIAAIGTTINTWINRKKEKVAVPLMAAKMFSAGRRSLW